MSTTLVPIETLGAEIKARVEAGDRALDKAEQHYIAAGIQLAEAKRRLEQTGEMRWSAFLFSHARIKRRRADDLIAIGEGRITLAEHRERNRERVAAHRERKRAEGKALRNAEPAHISSVTHNSRPDAVQSLLTAWEEADDEDRQIFLRKIGSSIREWYVPKHWLEDCAYELHLARGTPVPEALALKKQHAARAA